MLNTLKSFYSQFVHCSWKVRKGEKKFRKNHNDFRFCWCSEENDWQKVIFYFLFNTISFLVIYGHYFKRIKMCQVLMSHITFCHWCCCFCSCFVDTIIAQHKTAIKTFPSTYLRGIVTTIRAMRFFWINWAINLWLCSFERLKITSNKTRTQIKFWKL